MKATIYNLDGKKKGELELPKLFAKRIREDLAAKYFEADKFIQPYTHDPRAGRKHSASGTISHKRHDWKGHYGKGISRVPRKTMWRRGTQFMWIGAEVSGARGGRRVHGPKGIGKEKKINKKETRLALDSAFAATIDVNYVLQRYQTINDKNLKLPLVIESGVEKAKTKQLLNLFEGLLGDSWKTIEKKRKIRSGKGKLRGRKYKVNAGLLLIIGNDENVKMNGVDVRTVRNVSISDLYPLGRITVYTEKAMEDLRKIE